MLDSTLRSSHYERQHWSWELSDYAGQQYLQVVQQKSADKMD